MKILFVTQYYLPEIGPVQNRLSFLAAYLASKGHQVEVLTAVPNYPHGKVYQGYENKNVFTEFIQGVKVIHLGLYVASKRNWFCRLLESLSLTFNIFLKASKLVSKPDIIFLESHPLFLGMAVIPLAKQMKAKLITNVSDLWPQSLLEMGFLRKGFRFWLMERLEIWIYQNSDLILGQAQTIVENIKKRFPKLKVILYPNGVNPAMFDSLANSGIRKEFQWEGKIVIGYAGLLGHAQKLDQVLDAAILLKDIPQLHFAFFGDGPCAHDLANRISKEKIHNVKIYPYQTHNRIVKIMKAFDIGCVALADKKIFEGVRPSKMFEMMAAGLPVFFCGKGEMADLVTKTPEGPVAVVVPPENPQQLAAAIREVISDPSRYKVIGERAREFVLSQYDRAKISEKFEQQIVEIFDEKK